MFPKPTHRFESRRHEPVPAAGRPSRRAALFLGLALLTLPVVVTAESTPARAPASHRATKHAKARPSRAGHVAATPGAAAMRVALDPETKRATRPSPEAMRAAQVPASTFRPYVEYQADGSALAHLGDHFMSYSIVRYDSAGVAHHFCVEGAAAATRALQAPAPAPARPVRTEE